MADSEGPRGSGARGVTGRPPRRGPRLAGSLAFAALLAIVAALLAQPAGGFGPGAAHAAAMMANAATDTPSVSPSVSPTATTPPPTATPVPPTLSLVSPSTGKGPVGAHVTVSGQNFAGSSAAIFASQQKDCGGTQTPLASAPVNGGNLSQSFIWPTSLSGNGETYFICGTGMTGGAPGYLVLSSSQPTLTLSAASIQVGQQLTISGRYFLGLPSGSQVTIYTKAAGGSATTLTTAVVGDDGTFQFPWTVSGSTSAGDMTIQAQSAPEGAAAPALQAQATVTILAGSPTATGSPTVSATAATGGGRTSTGQQSGDNTGLVILLVVGMVLLLIVILAVVAVLLLKGKGGPPGQGGGRDDGYSAGAYPGYAERNRVPATVPPMGMTGRQAVPDQFGRSGPYDSTTMAGLPTGGVSQWDDPEPGPDAGWQPRPMTGYGRAYGTPGYPDTGYEEGPTNPSALDQRGGYGPADPWQDASAQYGGLPPLEDNAGGWGGATRASDPAVNPRQPADGWGDAPQGGRDQYPFPRGGGMGDTNPAGGDGG